MNTNIVLLNRNSQYCVFNFTTFQIFNISEYLYKLLEHLIKFGDNILTCTEYGIEPQELKTVLTQIGFIPNYVESAIDTKHSHKRDIVRITLHVSNDCNLRCKYCYANGGAYNNTRSLMTRETASRFVNYCCENFNSVENIVFFGGEPLLNPDIIKTVCQLFRIKYHKGEISKLPKFGAITNGTILTDEIYSLISEYFSFLTISVDGPKEINDINRIYSDGTGSYNSVNKFIHRVKTVQGLKIGIESTFTKDHIDAGYSHSDIQKFFYSEYGLSADVIDEITRDKEILISEDMEKPLESAWFHSFLGAIVRKQAVTKCDILNSIIAVSVNGEIYPCHMNVGDGMKPISSIWESDTKIMDKITHHDNYKLKNSSVCLKCWARNLCGGCSRSWYYNETTHNYSDKPNPDRCREFRRIARLAVLKIAEIRKDKAMWENLLRHYNIKN